jgi:hypothetical protein
MTKDLLNHNKLWNLLPENHKEKRKQAHKSLNRYHLNNTKFSGQILNLICRRKDKNHHHLIDSYRANT